MGGTMDIVRTILLWLFFGTPVVAAILVGVLALAAYMMSSQCSQEEEKKVKVHDGSTES